MTNITLDKSKIQSKNRGNWSVQMTLTALMVVFLVYFLLPLFWLLVSSTKSNGDLFSSFGLWFTSNVKLADNIQVVFTFDNSIYLKWLLNTAFYSIVSAVGAAFISTLGGYAFAKFRFPGKNILFTAILISVAVPITILILPLFLLLSFLNLINSPLAMILPSMVSPFGVYLMRIFAEESLPTELLEAARIDGAGETRLLTQMVLPLLLPGFVTVLLFSFVATWNNYFLPLLVFSKPDLYPLTVGLAQWNAQASVGVGGGGSSYATYSLVITGALIAIIPLLVAFVLLQRYWQSGLIFGSVKG
jgi:multiple sugar transport system permease protein